MGIVKKGLLTGIGAASIAKDKAEKIVKNIVEKGLMSAKDGNGLVKKLMAEAQREKNRVEKIIANELKGKKSVIKKGKKIVKAGISKAKGAVKKVGKMAERRGKSVVRRAIR